MTVTIDVEALENSVQEIDGVGEATAAKIKEHAEALDEGPANPSVDIARMRRAVRRNEERTLYRLIDELE